MIMQNCSHCTRTWNGTRPIVSYCAVPFPVPVPFPFPFPFPFLCSVNMPPVCHNQDCDFNRRDWKDNLIRNIYPEVSLPVNPNSFPSLISFVQFTLSINVDVIKWCHLGRHTKMSTFCRETITYTKTSS